MTNSTRTIKELTTILHDEYPTYQLEVKDYDWICSHRQLIVNLEKYVSEHFFDIYDDAKDETHYYQNAKYAVIHKAENVYALIDYAITDNENITLSFHNELSLIDNAVIASEATLGY